GSEGGTATLLNKSVVRNAGAGTGRQVDHLGPDILVLALAREGDADELRGSSGTDQVRPRNLPGAPRSQVHIDPFEGRVLVDLRPLRDEIVHFLREILKRDVADV